MIRKITLLMIFISTVSFSQDYRFGKVSKEELLETQHPTDPEADAAILYREVETRFEYSESENFYLVTDVFERVKIYNNDGFDWANKTVRIYVGSGTGEKISGLRGYTYYLDGDKVKDEKLRNDGIFETELSKFTEQVKFTMPNIQEGSVIEYKYSIKSPYISSIDTYRFQEEIPVNKVKTKFMAPEYFNYKMHQKGWIPFKIEEGRTERSMNIRYTEQAGANGRVGMGIPRSKSTTVNFQEYSYEVNLSNVPAMKEEAYSGNIENYMSALKFELSFTQFPNSTMEMISTTWEDVSKSIYQSDDFGNQLAKSNYFSKELKTITEGTTNPTEKAIGIFEYVKEHMNWNEYIGIYCDEGVRSAFKKGSGNSADINLMLVAMLREADLDANPVLISTKSNGIPIFPTRNGFNYVIAAVDTPDGTMLLDATFKNSVPNILREEFLNWQGRLVREDGSSKWVPLTPNQFAVENSMINYEIDPELLAIKGKYRARFTGHKALDYRDRYEDLTIEECSKKLEKSLTDTEIEAPQFQELNNIYKPLTLGYEFESYEAVEEISGKLYVLPLAFFTLKENPFKMESRQYPIDFMYPVKNRHIFTISIPEGYEVETLPESISFALGEGLGSFQYQIRNTGSMLQCSVEMNIEKSIFPSDFYGNLKQFFQLIVEKENEKIVLKKA